MLKYRLFYISVGLFWTCFSPFFIDRKIYARSVHNGSADGLYGVCCRTGKSENMRPIVPFSPVYTQSINCKQKLQEVELVALKVELRYWNSGFPSLIFPSAIQVRNDKKKKKLQEQTCIFLNNEGKTKYWRDVKPHQKKHQASIHSSISTPSC